MIEPRAVIPSPAPLASPQSALEIRGLTVTYGAELALAGASLSLPAGVMAAVVGPNGAGKSTLIKAALGLVPASHGQALAFGAPISAMRKRIAYVPQRQSVDWDFPVTVREAVVMGLYGQLGWLRRPGRKERARAMTALEELGIPHLADRPVGALSGGQQQRVFLARALVQQADLLILDEPMAGIDAPTEAAITRVLQAERDAGRTVLVVHHDLSTVQRDFDWLVLLNRKVIAAGPVTTTWTEGNLAATYGGALAVLAGHAAKGRADA